MKAEIQDFINLIYGYVQAGEVFHWNADNENKHEKIGNIITNLNWLKDVVAETYISYDNEMKFKLMLPELPLVSDQESYTNEVILFISDMKEYLQSTDFNTKTSVVALFDTALNNISSNKYLGRMS